MQDNTDAASGATLPTIRVASSGDAPAIAHVHVAAWRTAYQGIVPAEILESLSEESRCGKWREFIAEAAPPEVVFVAQQDGETVGFAHCGRERSGDPRHEGELYAIYLLDAVRGKGIGTALFQRVVDWLQSQGLGSMKLWVLEENPYRGFYDRMGGTLVDEMLYDFGTVQRRKVAYGWQWPPSG